MNSEFFRKRVVEARLHNPSTGFRLEDHPIEYRVDPLAGHTSRVNVRRLERGRQVPQGQAGVLERIIEKSRRNCLFCPENVEEKTPRFPEDLIPGGRLRRGGCLLFPNLYPFSEYHGVVVFSGEHTLMPADFPLTLFQRGFSLAVDFARTIHRKHPAVQYASINWNHLPPAGATIIHPHLQVPLDRKPTRGLKNLLEACEAYHRETGENYWTRLVEEEEKAGERLLFEDGCLTWLASYAPQGNNEVLGVFKDASNLLQLDQRRLKDLSRGLSSILRGYRSLGADSFNMTLYSGPFHEPLPHYSMTLKVISRPQFQPYYTGDRGFMETLHHEVVVESSPEELTKHLKPYFLNKE